MSTKKKTALRKGRPTKFCREYCEQARKLCQLGATDAEMAEFFKIGEATLNRWKHEHADFRESIKDGKIVADAEVADRLFKRATGYSHPDVHISNYQGEITVTKITKHYPPDTVAGIFWLKNRRPLEWREKVDLQHSGSVDIEVTIGGDDAE